MVRTGQPFRERLRRGAALRGDQIADGFAAEIRFARAFRKLRIDARPSAPGADRDDGHELVARAGVKSLLRCWSTGPSAPSGASLAALPRLSAQS